MEKFITKLLIIALSGFIVWLTWNPLIPELTGMRSIDYWESVILFILCDTLFKGGAYPSTQKD